VGRDAEWVLANTTQIILFAALSLRCFCLHKTRKQDVKERLSVLLIDQSLLDPFIEEKNR
jgi:hypothetical protein